ncbi:MAG: tyrosine-type recombinase/integrase [Fusobacterium sp. JB021]|nr:tyrosine-type recombinase/integrase [Fusobacterium sp. JB020]MDP0494512.1 tyrosine-type recombinase/integrase [Fusobacterium sp. JB021]MDP0507392.1 tyrosine-type recombinase/integrase [Fusobacterium sp. JB019]
MFQKNIKNFLFYSEFTENKSENTIKSLKKDLEQLEEYLKENGVENFKEVNSIDLRGFIVNLQKNKISKRSMSRKISSIRVFYRYLKENNFISKNPAELIIAPSFQVEIPEILSMEEIGKLREIIDISKCNGLRDRLILELLFSSGITPMELIMLSEQAINIDRREAVVKNGKEIRVVFFSEITRKYLELYIEAKKIKYKDKYNKNIIFVNGAGTRLSDRSLRRLLVKYGKKAEIKKEVNPFIFRHTFGSYMLSHGMNINYLKELMGHKNIETTKLYQELIKKPTVFKSLNIN